MLTAPGNILTMKTEARMGYISSFIIIAVVLLLNPSFARAEVKEIIAEGAYNMGDGETPSVAESRALLSAKQTALEQAGTYVESYIKVENLQLTKDEIQVLSSGIMEVTLLDKKRDIVGDGFRFWVKIKARVELDKIDDMAKRVKEKSIVEDYKKVQEAYAKSENDIAELKKQLAEAKGAKQKKQVEKKITDEERLFQANEWFDKGNSNYLDKKYEDAIEAYTSAIAINPDYAVAYYNRGLAYYEKGQDYKAIEDYSKAIAIAPDFADAYSDRGYAYAEKGQYERAIEDYSKAIAINPNVAYLYLYRGYAYDNKGQHDKAIEDYSKVIAITPNSPNSASAFAFFDRGYAYAKKGQYDRAIEDYSRLIAINPNDAEAYYYRGKAYRKKGQLDSAIFDFSKACDMGNKVGCMVLKGLKDR